MAGSGQRARRAPGPRPSSRLHLPPTPRLGLHLATDGGRAVDLAPEGRSWDEGAQGFLRQNGAALEALDVRAAVEAGSREVRVRLYPGARIGAVPLRSGRTGQVTSGLVVRPRFGWAGVGRVLEQTGWGAMPEMLAQPLVPGSGREVPPWVIAGPALRRLRDLLARVRRGYRMAEAVLPGVRGRVDWTRYALRQVPRGAWAQFPCRFPDLGQDPALRAEVRFALERIRLALLGTAGRDVLALRLAEEAVALLATLADVAPVRPARARMAGPLGDPVVEAGLQALAWVAEERGLGGPAELHGLAWASALDALWEGFVTAAVRGWAAATGGSASVARERSSLVPIHWRPKAAVSLGHLAPDVVVRVGGQVVIFDAKYKAHLAGLDADGWRAFSEQERAAHRADVHQALAYAALFEAETVTSVLVYPLRAETWRRLWEAGRTVLVGDLGAAGRRVRLALAGLPFGADGPAFTGQVRAAWRLLTAG